MLQSHRKTLILTTLITLLPILVGLYFWKDLPEVMATHFGSDNLANGFSSKAFAVFGIPIFCAAMEWVGAFFMTYDPSKKNMSPKLLTFVLWIFPVVSLLCAIAIYPFNLGHQMDITFIMEVSMGLLFIVVGNYLPKARQNYTVGIRIPWTLANEENWNRTHRIGGYIWVAGGILILLFALAGIKSDWVLEVFLLVALLPMVYSFYLHVYKNL